MVDFLNSIKEFSTDVQIKLEKLYPIAIINYSEEKYFEIITQLINEFGLYGELADRNSKEIFFGRIIGRLFSDLDNLIGQDKIEFLVILLRLLEYNRYLAFNMMAWTRNKESNFIDTINKIEDSFSKSLLSFFEFNKSETQIHYSYEHFEKTIALSQGGIELSIERNYYISQKSDIERNRKLVKISEYRYNELFRICFMLQIIVSLKSQYTIGELSKYRLIIDDNGITPIKTETFSDDPYYDYYNYIINKEQFYNNIYNDTSINDLIKKYYGLNFSEMYKVINDCRRENLTETFVVDRMSLIDFIVKNTGLCLKDVELFVDNLIFKLDTNQLFIDDSNKCRKASRKCLVGINDIYIFPIGLLSKAIMNIHMDLSTGDSNYEEVSAKIKDFLQKKNDRFEIEVYNKLLVLQDAIVMRNIQNIPDGVGHFVIPNQIDIILLYRDVIYVIECKDMPLKITPKKISNTENKFRKEYNKKLKGKIDDIIKNKEIVLKHLGDNSLNYINSEIGGLFVLSEYFNSSKEILEFPNIIWTQLIEYLNHN